MTAASPPPAIFNYQLQRAMIGVTALALPVLVFIFGCSDLTSISASYHSNSRDIFVGCLVGVGCLMFPYRGKRGDHSGEFWASKIAAVAALLVALVPTDCPQDDEPGYACLVDAACDAGNPGLHFGAAVVVFVCLGALCVIFRARAKKKDTPASRARASIYAACIGVILAGAALIVVDKTVGAFDTAVFWGEAVMLAAFACAWLTASQLLYLRPKRRPPA